MQPIPLASSPATVEITGWRVGLAKVSHTKALQQHASLSLGAAKAATDAVLGGKMVAVELPTEAAAELLAARLCELGAVARVRARTQS